MNPAPDKLSSGVHALVEGGMSTTLHWFSEDVSVTQLASTMVGMANADGGTIILGVSPRLGELIGVNNPQSVQERAFQAALLSEPTLVLPIAQEVRVSTPGVQKQVTLMLIHVPKGLPHVYSLEGKYYGRNDARTEQIPSSQLYKLIHERGSVQFETRLVPEATLDDLDNELVMQYAQSAGNIPARNLEGAYDFLVKRGCLKPVDREYQVTYAALLLFGKQPQQWLPNATILAGRFPSLGMSDTYIKQDISGCLPEQLRQAEDFLRTNLKTIVRLDGLTHVERLEYPFEAVRELLVNAVAHRDYNLQGDCIHLNIFADRLEVASPGMLPGPVNLQNLLVARYARNAVVTQVLSDLGFVERLGYGLDRVVAVLQKEGLPPPEFEELAGTFKVTLYAGFTGQLYGGEDAVLSRYSGLELNLRQQTALAYLATHRRITSHEFQSLCSGVHAESLRRDLSDLVSKGVLIKVGDKKATYYILKKV